MTDIIGAGNDAPAGGADLIKDGSIETFQDDVMTASQSVPVIVDFWAPWCGPCKTLGPQLEKAVTALKGQVKMVKMDIDQNQMLAQQLRIQSVPTVMAFVGGRPVDGFAGAIPESEIQAFLKRALDAASQMGLAGGNQGDGPDPEEALTVADQSLEQGDINTAAQLYAGIAEMLEEDNTLRSRALAGLARCHLKNGDTEKARQMLDMVPSVHASESAVASARAALDLQGAGGDLAEAEAKARANPDDLQAQYDYAEAQIGAGQMEDAGDTLLSIIAADREWNEEAARKKLLTVFDALGPADPVTLKIRRKLSSILFS